MYNWLQCVQVALSTTDEAWHIFGAAQAFLPGHNRTFVLGVAARFCSVRPRRLTSRVGTLCFRISAATRWLNPSEINGILKWDVETECLAFFGLPFWLISCRSKLLLHTDDGVTHRNVYNCDQILSLPHGLFVVFCIYNEGME